jgi:hypothetical protein
MGNEISEINSCQFVAIYVTRLIAFTTEFKRFFMQYPCLKDVDKAFWTTGLNFWHWSFTFNSNKLQPDATNFSVYYSDVCLQPNMFRAFFRPSSEAQ